MLERSKIVKIYGVELFAEEVKAAEGCNIIIVITLSYEKIIIEHVLYCEI